MSMELPGLGNVSVSVLAQITQSCLIGVEIGERSVEREDSKYVATIVRALLGCNQARRGTIFGDV